MTTFRISSLCCLLTAFFVNNGAAALRSNPAETVVLEAQTGIGTSAGDVWVSDGFAYVARFGASGVSIIDVRDPANPQIASVYGTSATNGTWDVKAANGFAYLTPQWSGYGLVILDVTDPYNPVLVTNYTHSHAMSCHNVWIDEDRQIAYLASNTTEQVEVVDISDPWNPSHLGHFGSSSGGIHDMVVQGDVLYASFLDGGLYLGSLATSPIPTLIGFVEYPGAFTHNAWPTEDGMYALTTDEYQGASIRIWDVSDPQNMNQVASYLKNPEATPHNVLVRNRYAFISYYTEGLVVLDISDPENPVEVGHYDTYPPPGGGFNGAWGVFPYDDYVYVSDMVSGLFTFSFKPVTIALTEITSTVQRGGTLSYRATIEEQTDFPVTFNGEANVFLPGGNAFGGNPVLGPVELSIDPLGLISGRLQHIVPMGAPLGTYEYVIRIEDTEGHRFDSTSFQFRIVDTR